MRNLKQIANDIKSNWKNVYFGAVPYLDAMCMCENISDTYGMEDCVSIVNYFLANATYWRGEKAREIKKELNNMIKEFKEHPENFPEGKVIELSFIY